MLSLLFLPINALWSMSPLPRIIAVAWLCLAALMCMRVIFGWIQSIHKDPVSVVTTCCTWLLLVVSLGWMFFTVFVSWLLPVFNPIFMDIQQLVTSCLRVLQTRQVAMNTNDPLSTFGYPSLAAVSLLGFMVGYLLFGPVRRNHESQSNAPSSNSSTPVILSNLVTLDEIRNILSSALQPLTPNNPPTPTTTLNAEQVEIVVQEQIEKALKPIMNTLEHLAIVCETLPSSYLVSASTEEILRELREKPVTTCNHSTPVITPITPEDMEEPFILPARRHVTNKFRTESAPVNHRDPNPFDPLDEYQDEISEHDPPCPSTSIFNPLPIPLEEMSYTKTVGHGNKGTKPHSTGIGKRHPSVRSASVDSQPPMSPELQLSLASMTEAQALDELRKREMQKKLETREPEYLTDAERLLSLDALSRHWKLEGQRRRAERERLNQYDFEPLGELTHQQKLLKRRDIKAIVRARKNQIWARAMEASGKEVITCEVCQHKHTGDHQCISTGWKTADNSRSTTSPRTVILTRSNQGVQVRTTPVVDKDKVYAEFAKLKATIEVWEASEQAASPNTTHPTPPTRTFEGDTHMEEVSPIATTPGPIDNGQRL